MNILQNIIALVIFFCVAAVLIYVGVYILLAVLIVVAAAFAWYSVKFWFLRKEIEKTLKEHQGMTFSEALRRQQQADEPVDGTVIEGEFEEIEEERK